jgi:N-methylhydantoinase A/oxoprolinase/acetone carboxylase beta subunit
MFEEKPGAFIEPRTRRPVYVRGKGWTEAAIYAWNDLVAGPRLAGPAVIERESTTIWLPPEASATLDIYGNLAVDPGS